MNKQQHYKNSIYPQEIRSLFTEIICDLEVLQHKVTKYSQKPLNESPTFRDSERKQKCY
jgi:hypothetical protein